MLRTVLCLCLLLVPAAALPACGGGGDGTPPPAAGPRQYLGTQAPGDLWTWSINTDTTWTASNDTLSFDYDGSWALLPSGFLKLTIEGTDDPGTTVGDVAYALEVPDTVLVVKPAGADENVIIAARVGACPAGPTLALNYCEMTDSGWNPLADDAYGVAAVTVAGATWTGTNSTYLLNGTANGTGPIPTFTCAGGVATNTTDPDDVIVVSPTGVFISDSGPGAGGVMGLAVPAAPIVLADLIAPGREYRAIQYVDEVVGDDDCRPNYARPNGAGGLTGGDYVNVETNVEDVGSVATILFTAQPLPGIVNGTLTDGAGTRDIVFIVNRVAGRYVMFGVSVNSHSDAPYNFIAIEMP